MVDDNDYKEVPVDGEVYLGSRVYMVNCASCHSLETTTNNVDSGPTLGLIFNRKVATDINYLHYSKAAIEKSFHWSTKNLYNFLIDPFKLIPGTRCGVGYKPVKSESDRADLVSFFKEYSKELELNTRI
jgi:cytochrome c